MDSYRSVCVPIRGLLHMLWPLLLTSLTSVGYAQFTNTWAGSGTNANWSNAANWNGRLIPVSSASTALDFTGTASTSANDLGTFQLNLIQFNVTADLTLSGNDLNFVSNGSTTPMLTQDSASKITINNNLVLSDNLILNLGNSGNVKLTGVISGAGGLTITAQQANYTAILSNSNNSYTGDTTLEGGTLQLGANNALASGTNLNVAGNGKVDAALDLNGHTITVNNITFGDGTSNSTNNITIIDSSVGQTGSLTLNGNITYNASPDLDTPTAYINANMVLASGQHVINNNGEYGIDNYDMILTGHMTGTGGLDLGVVNGPLPQMYTVLANTNTYSGPTNIYNDSLYLGATNALPIGSKVTIGNYSSLYLYIASDYTEAKLTPGSYNQSIGSLADNDGQSNPGYVYLGAAMLTVGSDNTSTTFTGEILDNDGTSLDPTIVGGSLVKTGNGTLTLSGQSGYTGSTTINMGTLQLGTDDALPDLVNNVNPNLIVATNLTLTGGTFDMNGFSQTVNNVTNSGNVLVSGGSVLTLTGAYTQSGGITQVDGNLGLTPGQDLTLTGGQLVGVGTVGNASGTTGIATVTNSGGLVHPGDLLPSIHVGTLTINGNYSQTSGGTLQIDLAGATSGTYDVLAVQNNASLAGTLNIKLLNGFVPIVGETFEFLTYGGTVSGNFASIVGLDPGYTYTDSFANGLGTLTVAAVPESSTLLSATVILGIGGLLLWRQRRGRKSLPL